MSTARGVSRGTSIMSMHIPAGLHSLHLLMYLATPAMPSLDHSGCCNLATPLVEAHPLLKHNPC